MTLRAWHRRLMRRRSFLGLSAALGALGAALTSRAARGDKPNPYAYDISAHLRTDPKLLLFEETTRFKTPRPDARRLALVAENRLALATGKYVSMVDFTGARLSEIEVEAPVRCMASAADGTLYLSLRDHLEVFDAKGRRQAAWESPARKTWFSGLAVNESDVFAADSGNRVVLRYDRSGKLAGRIGDRDPARQIPGFVLPSPYLDVKWGRDGLLRVTNPGRHRVECYTPAGELEFAFGKPSLAIDGFCGCCNPVAIALTGEGRVITCEKGLPRVKVYSPRGEFEGVVAGAESFPENAKVGAGETLADGSRSSLDAVVEAGGRVFVLDTVTAEVRVFAAKHGGKA